uniref:Uncharacterized protein n=1 Tax=viral metagenome TaxID=1070528 RepID=A0A6C0BDY6_9ZZZZ
MGCIFSGCRKQRDVVKAHEEVLEVKAPEVKVPVEVLEVKVLEVKAPEVPVEVLEEPVIEIRNVSTLNDLALQVSKTLLKSIGHNIFNERALLDILIELYGYTDLERIILNIFKKIVNDNVIINFFENISSYLHIEKNLIYFACKCSEKFYEYKFYNYIIVMNYSTSEIVFLHGFAHDHNIENPIAQIFCNNNLTKVGFFKLSLYIIEKNEKYIYVQGCKLKTYLLLERRYRDKKKQSSFIFGIMKFPIKPKFRINSVYFDNNDSQLVINDNFRMYFLENSSLKRRHICGFWEFDKNKFYPRPIYNARSLE